MVILAALKRNLAANLHGGKAHGQVFIQLSTCKQTTVNILSNLKKNLFLMGNFNLIRHSMKTNHLLYRAGFLPEIDGTDFFSL